MIELYLEIVGALLCDNNSRAATQNQIWVIEPARNDIHALLCVLNMLIGHMSVVLFKPLLTIVTGSLTVLPA
jgi:hypothetical protein